MVPLRALSIGDRVLPHRTHRAINYSTLSNQGGINGQGTIDVSLTHSLHVVTLHGGSPGPACTFPLVSVSTCFIVFSLLCSSHVLMPLFHMHDIRWDVNRPGVNHIEVGGSIIIITVEPCSVTFIFTSLTGACPCVVWRGGRVIFHKY